MTHLFFSAMLIIVAAPTTIFAAMNCNEDVSCAEAAPCCSEYGVCGTTPLHCGGGCQSELSYNDNACYADRMGTQCVSGTYDFSDETTWIMNADAWNGDPYIADFLVDPTFIPNLERDGTGGMSLYLTEPSVAGKPGDGCRLSSTSYLRYGIFTVRLKSGAAPGGMVTSFISLSDVRDEIDWEWVGGKPNMALTSLFHRGNTTIDETRGADFELDNPASEVAHEYSVDWNADRIIWSIDGVQMRTVTRGDRGGRFPDTPSRIQIGVWDAGASESVWTQIWAGGPIDWTQTNRGYSASVESVSIQCAGDNSMDGPPARKERYTAPSLNEAPIARAHIEAGVDGSDFFEPGTPLSERPASGGVVSARLNGLIVFVGCAAATAMVTTL